jgi:A/G-specific adenine glycosylase
VPERNATLLVLRHGSRVLVERRPPAGIWGGLLSLPELPVGIEPAPYALNHLSVRIFTVAPAPTFAHTFTHFRLRILPLLCEVEPQAHAAESGRQWLNPEELARAALPAPIRKILSAIP